jgi:DNA-binding LacI/PurR family transcriptional regulator
LRQDPFLLRWAAAQSKTERHVSPADPEHAQRPTPNGEAGAEPPPPLIGDWSPGAGYELGRQLAADPEVTAIFVANDQMALGVLRALHLAGREVPGDVSLVGFDDIPEARYLTPPLTTIRQDFDEVGRRSLLRLLQAIDPDAEASPRVTVTPELIVRESTAGAPRPAP